MKNIVIILLLLVLRTFSQNTESIPVKPPYPKKLDTAATNKWWEVARKARNGNIDFTKRHPKKSITVSGRHFLDLEVPRDEVVAFCLYTVHNRTLKLSAQLFPLFPNESRQVSLEVDRGNGWKQISKSTVNDLGWSALFRIENWDDTKSLPYRVRHGKKAMYEGTIRNNPVDKDEIVVASLSCNSSRDRMGRPNYVRNLLAVDPDLIFFAGDQHYDHTEHTAGWLMFGLQFRETFRDRPVVTIPDDHDVGQPNLWGEGGIKADHIFGNAGGYYYHAEYVKQVERCQTSHLPDPVDPGPIGQGIGVYFTSYNLGGVDFAILEDRKFKSGPNGKIPQQGPRPDHIRNPAYDPKSIDLPGLVLLGERQLNFLNQWSADWQGVQMKAVLSQTPFAGAAHLHGGGDPQKYRLHADMDSNGWPQTGRNRGLRAIRKGFAVHLAGDQHLSTLLQHGIDEFNDGPWSIVSPAIVNSVYGRYWHPENEAAGKNKPKDNPLPFTGEYLDGFNNKLTMHAYVNANEPENLKCKAAGFVVARFNKKSRTIIAECWPRDADLTKSDAQQFKGWPRVIDQIDNYYPDSWSHSGILSFDTENPVIQVIEESSNEVLYTLRVKGRTFIPHLPKNRTFHIKAGVDKPTQLILKGINVKNIGNTYIQLK